MVSLRVRGVPGSFRFAQKLRSPSTPYPTAPPLPCGSRRLLRAALLAVKHLTQPLSVGA